ncbi:MAG: MOSC domain-containing protein [Bdellovibrionales bacterium]
MAIIRDLYFYPIKSFRGFRTAELELTPNGAKWDRQWMLVDENQSFLTQRQIPGLARIGVRFEDDVALELSTPEQGVIDFGLEEQEGEALSVTVWKTQVPAFEVSSEVSQWLSDVLSRKVKLVRFSDDAYRPFPGGPTEAAPDVPRRGVRFMDQQPLLVISTASLKELEARASVSLSMSRFRPNVVIDQVPAHAEDTWPEFSVGSIRFQAIKPCSRCKITTVHPLTGEVSEEPLKTLATYRKQEKGVMFGYYYAHLNEGRLKVGAPLSLL